MGSEGLVGPLVIAAAINTTSTIDSVPGGPLNFLASFFRMHVFPWGVLEVGKYPLLVLVSQGMLCEI